MDEKMKRYHATRASSILSNLPEEDRETVEMWFQLFGREEYARGVQEGRTGTNTGLFFFGGLVGTFLVGAACALYFYPWPFQPPTCDAEVHHAAAEATTACKAELHREMVWTNAGVGGLVYSKIPQGYTCYRDRESSTQFYCVDR